MIVRVPGSSPYEARYSYCRVVIAGEWAITAGTTATGADGVLHPGDAYRQAQTAFEIALEALGRVGVPADRVVRTRMYIVDAAHESAVGQAHGEVFGDARPVATMVVVAGLIDPAMLVEVELEAYTGSDRTAGR